MLKMRASWEGEEIGKQEVETILRAPVAKIVDAGDVGGGGSQDVP